MPVFSFNLLFRLVFSIACVVVVFKILLTLLHFAFHYKLGRVRMVNEEIPSRKVNFVLSKLP